MARAKATSQDLSNKLNKLESTIVNAEDSAEDARYRQAEIVAQMLDSGMTQRQVAGDWYNGRTGKPYDHVHVLVVARVWKRFGSVRNQDRPTWGDAYATVKEGADEIIDTGKAWGNRMEARAPKSEETAEKLVQNLLKESPEIADTVYQGLHEGRQNRYIEPAERERRRKAADAFASDVGEPIRDTFSKLNVILYMENALENLREMASLDDANYLRGMQLLDGLRTEFEVKHAMAEMH